MRDKASIGLVELCGPLALFLTEPVRRDKFAINAMARFTWRECSYGLHYK